MELKVEDDGEYQKAVASLQVVAGGKMQVFVASARSRSQAKAIAYALEAVALEILKADGR